MAAKDIGLIMCPIWDTRSPQLGLPLLKAYLNARGHGAFAFDFAIRLFNRVDEPLRRSLSAIDPALLNNPESVRKMFSDYEDVVDKSVEECLDSGAQVFGFSLYNCNWLSVLEFARRIKAKDPSRVIAYGGPECVRYKAGFGLDPRERALLDVADVLVPGEGEIALDQFLRRFRDGPIAPSPGAFVKVNGGFVWGGDGEPVAQLDSLPLSDFSDYDLSDYEMPNQLATYMTRGCIRHCTFCDVEYYWGKYRSRSGRRVLEDISYQMKRHPGVSHFWFCDSIVNADVKELERFCDLAIEAKSAGSPSFSWDAYAIIRADMTKGLCDKMSQTGCHILHIGIESGSQQVLSAMKKGYHVRTAEKVLGDMHAAGIKTNLLLMVGYPTETEEDFQQTIDFLRRAAPYIYSISPSEAFTYIGVGTQLHERASDLYNVDPQSMHSDYWRTLDGKNNYPERLRRFEVLCRAAIGMGIRIGQTLQNVEKNKKSLLAEYERHNAAQTK